jgi:hypothetical protein
MDIENLVVYAKILAISFELLIGADIPRGAAQFAY